MSDSNESSSLEMLLQAYRHTLAMRCKEMDQCSYASPSYFKLVTENIADREHILRIKYMLQQEGIAVQDHPLDTPPIAINLQASAYGSASLQATATLTVLHIQHPPKRAEYFLHYLPQKDRDEVIGDLEEEYQTMYKRFGPERARRWYWWQVAFSFWPYFKTGVKSILKWSTIGWVSHLLRLGLEYLRHFV